MKRKQKGLNFFLSLSFSLSLPLGLRVPCKTNWIRPGASCVSTCKVPASALLQDVALATASVTGAPLSDPSAISTCSAPLKSNEQVNKKKKIKTEEEQKRKEEGGS